MTHMKMSAAIPDLDITDSECVSLIREIHTEKPLTHRPCSLERSVLCHGQQAEHLCREYQMCEIIIINPSCLNLVKYKILIYHLQ